MTERQKIKAILILQKLIENERWKTHTEIMHKWLRRLRCSINKDGGDIDFDALVEKYRIQLRINLNGQGAFRQALFLFEEEMKQENSK